MNTVPAAAPVQPVFETLEPRLLLANTILVAAGSEASWLVPTSGSLGTSWTARTFTQGAAWATGQTGVGFERGSGYDSLIASDVDTPMYNKNGTCYIRVPFDVSDPSLVQSLTLRMKYDDGFIAYLNGTRVVAANSPTSPSWNSNASSYNGDERAVVFEDFAISSFVSSLVPGRNILAIQGLNAAVNSTDFVILPQLEAVTDDAAFRVTGTSPANGARLTSPPAQMTVDFVADFNGSTLNAADLMIDGQPASGVTVVDLDTARFDLPAGLAAGSHNVTIAAGAIQSATGLSLAAYAGTFTLVLAPQASTLPASNLLNTSARLNGEVLSTGGENPGVHFVWGPTDGGTTVGNWYREVVLGPTPKGPVHVDLPGLTAETPYYYRLFVVNSAGTTWAPQTVSFTTAAAQKPTVTTRSVGGLSPTSVRLSGEIVDTGGKNPDVHIVWGPSNGGATQANWAHDVSLGAMGAGVFSTDLAGLTEGATYFFSAYATNSAGTSWGASKSFQAREDLPVISEFMASNENTLADADGQYSDWIEIYNPSANDMNLAGWYLTDDKASLTKWTFPEVTIPGGQYLIVWASDKFPSLPGGQLHTNFKLSAGGEYLALVRPDGMTIVTEYEFPQQYPDISSGLSPDTEEVRFFATPTPGAGNSTNYWDIVSDTKFSVNRGLYTDPFDVTIGTKTLGATIRYTLDGSEPSETNGLTYAGPIHIATTTTLRAIAYKAGLHSTNIDTQSYIFLDDVLTQTGAGLPTTWSSSSGSVSADYAMDGRIVNDPRYSDMILGNLQAVPTMSIVMDWDDLLDPATGIYVNMDTEGETWERPASVELINPDGSEGFHIDAGIRLQGGWVGRTMGILKHSLRLLFKSEYGDSKLNYQLFPDSPVDEFDTITLRAGGNDQQLMIRDQWTRQAMLQMGQPAPHGTWVNLYINGLYWGLYNPTERPTSQFAASYLGGDKEEYDIIKKTDLGTEAPDGNMIAWNQVMELSRDNAVDDVEYESFKKLVDVDNLIDYMLVEFYAGNADWPGNNWYCGRQRVEGGQFHFFLWDTEYSMLLGVPLTIDKTGSGSTNGPWTPADIYASLRTNAEFRQLFADHAQRFLFNGGVLSAEGAAELFNDIAGEVDDVIVGETARWGDKGGGTPWTLETWQAMRDDLLVNWFPQRTDILLGQLRNRGLYPDTSAPTYSQHGATFGPGGMQLTLSNPNSSGAIYYTLDGSDPRLAGGAISSTAVAYSADIAISANATVKARILQDGQWSALEEASFLLDAAPPTVVSAEINAGRAQRSRVTSLKLTFSEDVTSSLAAGDLVIHNLTTGQDIPAGALSVEPDAASWTGIWTFPGLPGGTLPAGRYSASLRAAGVSDLAGNALDGNANGAGGDDFTLSFFCLPGDASGDGMVDVGDLGILGASYGLSGATLPADFTGDGTVDVGDLGVLGANYGSSLPAGQIASQSSEPRQAALVASPAWVPADAPQSVNPAWGLTGASSEQTRAEADLPVIAKLADADEDARDSVPAPGGIRLVNGTSLAMATTSSAVRSWSAQPELIGLQTDLLNALDELALRLM